MNTTALALETPITLPSGAGVPVLTTTSEHVGIVGVPPLQEGEVLALPSQAPRPGRAVRPNEVLSSTLPLVLVEGAEHGKETVLPGYYACVGAMPCADTDYYLLVRWEHRERGRQGERRVVLPEHIRVLDPAVVLFTSPHAVTLQSAVVSGLSATSPEQPVHLTPEAPTSTNGTGQQSTERYPQLQHFSKRKR
jgi:hypothetical protein